MSFIWNSAASISKLLPSPSNMINIVKDKADNPFDQNSDNCNESPMNNSPILVFESNAIPNQSQPPSLSSPSSQPSSIVDQPYLESSIFGDGQPDFPGGCNNTQGYEDFVTAENYFAAPEFPYGGSEVEIQSMIEDYKTRIQSIISLSSANDANTSESDCVMAKALWSEKKQDLVSKLVQLRIRQSELKDSSSLQDLEFKKILGHKFKKLEPSSSVVSASFSSAVLSATLNHEDTTKLFCEQCLGIIWRMIQVWHRCVCCGYACHSACLNHIIRNCVASKLQKPELNRNRVNLSFAHLSDIILLAICPEKGLSSQNYKCHECGLPLGFGSFASEEPRLCDYNGLYYCFKCHWNDSVVIPARVLHNWDFDLQLVSRSTYQFLKLIREKPLIRIADVNPMLFSFVSELDTIKTLREQILIMKRYLTTCKRASEEKLLLQLQHRQHFVDNSDMYSLQDLIDVHGGKLDQEIKRICDDFSRHICKDCELCKAKGFFCEHCGSEEILFPFGPDIVVCPDCANVSHRLCFRRNEGECGRCKRLQIRKIQKSIDETKS